MDREQTAQAVEVMKAYAAGADIEHRINGQDGFWRPCPTPAWSWGAAEYRARPDPMTCFGLVDESGAVVQCYRYWDTAEKHRRADPKLRLVHLVEVR